MTIDTVELRQRIQDVRDGLGNEHQPKAAIQPKGRSPGKWRGRARGSVLQRIYQIPVLGYGVRILTAIANFPRILTNLRAFQANHASDAERFHQTIDDLRLQIKGLDRQVFQMREKSDALEKALAELRAGPGNGPDVTGSRVNTSHAVEGIADK